MRPRRLQPERLTSGYVTTKGTRLVRKLRQFFTPCRSGRTIHRRRDQPNFVSIEPYRDLPGAGCPAQVQPPLSAPTPRKRNRANALLGRGEQTLMLIKTEPCCVRQNELRHMSGRCVYTWIR
jgi:hypothetical protein